MLQLGSGSALALQVPLRDEWGVQMLTTQTLAEQMLGKYMLTKQGLEQQQGRTLKSKAVEALLGCYTGGG